MRMTFVVGFAAAQMLCTSVVVADIVELRFISDGGFTSGPYAGEAAELLLAMDGQTGRQTWLHASRVEYSGVCTRVTLRVGGEVVLDARGTMRGGCIIEEGMNFFDAGGAGFGVQFSSHPADGPVRGSLPNAPKGMPSLVDQCLRDGLFTPSAFEPFFVPSFFNYGGNTAELSRLRVSRGCVADFNGDGLVDSRDFFDFLRVFFDGGSAADLNCDGMVNSGDFFDFLGAFFVGC